MRYREPGFDPVETGDSGRAGVRPGDTCLILATAEHMQGAFKVATVAPLVGRTIPSISGPSLEAAKGRLPASALVMEQVVTRYGTI